MNNGQDSAAADQWRMAAPAAVLSLLAALIAMYGAWIVPLQTPHFYQSRLEKSLTRYRDETRIYSKVDLANELELVFTRLISLENGSPQRYWERAQFLEEHAAFVRREVDDPAASFSDKDRERLLSQAKRFEAKAQDTFQQLAVGSSDLSAASLIHVAESQLRDGMAHFGLRDASQLAASLRSVLDERTRSASELLDAEQLESGQRLLLRVYIESAWKNHAGSRLHCDLNQLQQAWDWLQLCAPAEGSPANLEWLVGRRLLEAYRAEEAIAEADTEREATLPSRGRESGWRSRLAELQWLALQGEWEQIGFQLQSAAQVDVLEVRAGLSRTICRLACSPLARKKGPWSRQADVGLLLVAQLAPHLPEFGELMWQCGQLQTQVDDPPPQLDVGPEILAAIASGQSSQLKHSVFALAATMDGRHDVARTHLDLLTRSGSSLMIVARTALWKVQATPREADFVELDSLRVLLQSTTELEPDNGLNWFALGAVQLRSEQFSAALVSLENAKRRLGDAPAIQEMLKTARAASHKLVQSSAP
ncbi:MAG: hypothetical protein KDA45_01185 [Planctomycetales bacterium]|nr:hypothetical protein [Planctomycetales bacterium]